MRIIISPAKKMNMETDLLAPSGLPSCMKEARELLEWMRKLSYTEAKALWKCNDKIAQLNYERFAQMDLERNLTPAIIAYEGIQYQYMAPAVFEDTQMEYIQEHLRILSGFYGVLRPFDGVVPYRLEMQAKASDAGNLYQFWKDRLYREVMDGNEDRIILNLASKEYSRCIEKYLQPQDTFLTVVFGELIDGRVKQKGTLAKMARGEMVRFLAETRARQEDDIKEFDRLGYQYEEGLSSEKEYVFLATNK